MKVARLLAVALALGILAGCRGTPEKPRAETRAELPYDAPGLSMPERLAKIADSARPENMMFLNKARAALMQAQLASVEGDPRQTAFTLANYATELLNAGYPEDALRKFTRLERLMEEHAPGMLARYRRFLRMNQALAFLRIGEQKNCLDGHNAESCLLPIQGKGIHRFRSGSEGAARILTELLRENPEDLSARWLLNIASMTLGQYPHGVPQRWVIPPDAFAAEYDVGRFRDVAAGAGVSLNELSGGVIAEDFDGDGNLDLMTSSVGMRDPLRCFRNDADGAFSERTNEAGLTGQNGGLNLVCADYDNDGRPDVVVLRGGWFPGELGRHPLSLLRNNGDGTFSDVTESAGLLRFKPTQTAVWFDYDADGWLDLFVGNESVRSSRFPCELFRNNGNGTFTECAESSGLDVAAYVKAAVSADYNNDGRPDLFLSCYGEPNRLFRNDGPAEGGRWKFTDVTAKAGVASPRQSFPCAFFDYNEDGWPDLFVASYGHLSTEVGEVAASYLGRPSPLEPSRLYRNNGNGTFTDVAQSAGLTRVNLAMALNFGDLDNDGWLDFYVGTGNPSLLLLVPNLMFRNAGGDRFQNVTTSGGFGHLQKGHGIAFADFNNDGNQDVFEKMGGIFEGDRAFSVLFENPGHPNRWITLKLEGTRTNRAAIGARVTVNLLTPNGKRSLHRTVGTGASFGCNPLRLEIGCGNATAIEGVSVFWPAPGKTELFRGLQLDRFYRLRQGSAAPEIIPLRRFALSRSPAAHHHGK